MVLISAADARAQSVCTWGGTPLEPTGTFTLDPGLRFDPSPTALAFGATGPLAGDDPRCAGTMTFDGTFPAGASCSFFMNFGTVSGVPGIASYFDMGDAASVGYLYGTDGTIVGTFQPLLAPADFEAAREACETPEGFKGARDSVVVQLFR
jgi:hypothetical protein